MRWFCLALMLLTLTAPATASEAPFLRVLGIAQDGGLPHAACTCVRCEDARQSEPPYYVSSLGLVIPGDEAPRVYLFDATPDIRGQLDLLADVRQAEPGRTDRTPVDGVFLTHAHIGHYTGLMFFGYESIFTRRLPVYATESMSLFLTHNGPWSELVRLESIVITPLTGSGVQLSGDIQVRWLKVPHRDELADTVGFVIEGPDRTALFVPDTDGWNAWERPLPEVIDEEGVDLAFLDATFFSLDELPGRSIDAVPHPLMRSTMDLLQDRVDAGSLEVVFIHLNHSNPALDPDGEAQRETRQRGFALAREGQTYALAR